MTTDAGVQFQHPPMRADVSMAEAFAFIETIVGSEGLADFSLTINITREGGDTIQVTDSGLPDIDEALTQISWDIFSSMDEMGWTLDDTVTIVAPFGAWRNEP